jgi:hypothetical protein
MFFVSCINSKTEYNTIVFNPHVKQYLDIYINDNKVLHFEKNAIIIQCKTLSKSEFDLSIRSEMLENVDFIFTDNEDSIYFGHYKEFRIYIMGDHKKILKTKYNTTTLSPSSYPNDIVPISYNGVFWNLRVEEGEIKDFSYQYCTPKNDVLEKLKAVNIQIR